MITYTLTLLDKTQPNRTPSTDLPISITGTSVGDLKPWFVSLRINHTTLGGRVTNGELKLKLDVDNRFVRNTPILIDEFAKNKYLIEWKGTQNIGGSNVDSKTFVFQITSAITDVDKFNGFIITIKLTEQWVRMNESFSSVEHRFITPKQALVERMEEFNAFQTSNGVFIGDTTAATLPDVDNLKQNYVPEAPTSIMDLTDDILERLGDPNVSGGVFKDYYKDFEPSVVGGIQQTNVLKITAEEFGATSSGVILDPKNIDTIDSTTEQTNVTDNYSYKNHVILRCGARDGTLPQEHMIYASNFLHAAGTRSNFKGRPEWDSDKAYKKGEQVKTTVSVPITIPATIVVRFFECIQDLPLVGPYTSPDQNPTHWKEDFTAIPRWSTTGRYFIGDLVYYPDPLDSNKIKYFRCKANKTDVSLKSVSSPSPPTVDTTTWAALSPTVPSRLDTNFTHWYSPSIWTEDLRSWTANLTGRSNTPIDSDIHNSSPYKTYVGYAIDWNISRDTYDQQDYTQIYDTINVKTVYQTGVNVDAAVLTTERYHGMRVLLGASVSSVSDFKKDFDLQVSQGLLSGSINNRIAEVDATTPSSATGKAYIWRFSRSPQTGDTVTDLFSSTIKKWDGSAWVTSWSVATLTDRPTPFHLVGNVLRTRGATGIPASAIEWRFKWSSVAGFSIGDFRNNSNGVWINWFFPFPKEDTSITGGKTIGHYYGGNTGDNSDGLKNDLNFCTLDTFNYTLNHKGKKTGWNNGLDSQDLGKITGMGFKLKVGFFSASYHDTDILDPKEFDTSASTTAVTGMANMPMIFWALDIFDRVWYYKFNVRTNNQWESFIIPFGDLAPQSLHQPRYDELPNFWGYIINTFSPGVKEKEYQGVAFDWRFVRASGIFYNGGYDVDYGYYSNGTEQGFKKFFQTLQQIGIGALYVGSFGTVNLGTVVINSSSITIDEIRFIKELIVNSDDAVLAEPRTKMENRLNEFDYFNAKKIANGIKKRLSFFPQTWNMRTHGDVRMRVGKRFIVKGSTVPNGEVEMVCAEVAHIINNEGYMMEVVGQRKFETEG